MDKKTITISIALLISIVTAAMGYGGVKKQVDVNANNISNIIDKMDDRQEKIYQLLINKGV